ncbi:unnamed protein product, partial [Darwinula stevensoni]
RVACDWGIDSSALEDKCGVCLGDGSQCSTVTGLFATGHGVGYKQVVEIPAGAFNVRVAEVSSARNFLALKGESGYYLNGDWYIKWSGEYVAGGSYVYYQRMNDTEEISIPGPVKEPLQVMLLFQVENPGVTWEYTIASENTTRTPEYQWEYLGWTPCTRTCGSGNQALKTPK